LLGDKAIKKPKPIKKPSSLQPPPSETKKGHPPSFGLGKANRREPHTKRGQLAALPLSGDQNQRNPLAEGGF